MSDLQDKTLGCWMGMAVGDAMGSAVRGLKQETVHQYFRRVDGYVDGGAFVGKGIKLYRMPGLYGCQTQRALALSEVLLKNKKPQADDLTALIGEMAADGPEFYFGLFRHADGPFRKAVEEWPALSPPLVSSQKPCNLNYAALAVPLALYHQRTHDSLLRQCVETCLLFGSHPLEISAACAHAGLICFFAGLGDEINLAEEDLPAEEILQQAVAGAERAEEFIQENFPGLETGGKNAPRLSAAVAGLRDQFFQSDLDGLLKWICEYVSRQLDAPINNPSQGHALALFPLALTLVLKFGGNFSELMAQCMKLGREADKLGALAGAWGGALLGHSQIPEPLKSGLANSRELKIRGEALFYKKLPKQAKAVLEMERGLTLKESELQKKYRVEPRRKGVGKPTASAQDTDFEDSEAQALKDDPQLARKFQKQKTRSKRDRRRNLF